MWKTQDVWIGKPFEFCHYSSVDYSGWKTGRQKHQEKCRSWRPYLCSFMGREKKSIINMARGNSCVVLAHNSPVFWPCPENFNDIKFKDARLICFLGEYSRQESIQFGAEKSALTIREISITDKKSLVLCFNYRKDVLQANPHPLEVPFGKNRD